MYVNPFGSSVSPQRRQGSWHSSSSFTHPRRPQRRRHGASGGAQLPRLSRASPCLRRGAPGRDPLAWLRPPLPFRLPRPLQGTDAAAALRSLPAALGRDSRRPPVPPLSRAPAQPVPRIRARTRHAAAFSAACHPARCPRTGPRLRASPGRASTPSGRARVSSPLAGPWSPPRPRRLGCQLVALRTASPCEHRRARRCCTRRLAPPSAVPAVVGRSQEQPPSCRRRATPRTRQCAGTLPPPWGQRRPPCASRRVSPFACRCPPPSRVGRSPTQRRGRLPYRSGARSMPSIVWGTSLGCAARRLFQPVPPDRSSCPPPPAPYPAAYSRAGAREGRPAHAPGARSGRRAFSSTASRRSAHRHRVRARRRASAAAAGPTPGQHRPPEPRRA